jgi:hypothetical protein
VNRVRNVLLLILVALALSLVIAVIYGALHWRARTNDLRAKLEAERSIIGLTRDESRELDGLPLPVQRCFSAALTAGRWSPPHESCRKASSILT